MLCRAIPAAWVSRGAHEGLTFSGFRLKFTYKVCVSVLKTMTSGRDSLFTLKRYRVRSVSILMSDAVTALKSFLHCR